MFPDLNCKSDVLICPVASWADKAKLALDRIMIGGNHIATYRADNWPDYDKAEPLEALEIIGAGASYDMWCCWREIMLARDALSS